MQFRHYILDQEEEVDVFQMHKSNDEPHQFFKCVWDPMSINVWVCTSSKAEIEAHQLMKHGIKKTIPRSTIRKGQGQ